MGFDEGFERRLNRARRERGPSAGERSAGAANPANQRIPAMPFSGSWFLRAFSVSPAGRLPSTIDQV